MDSRLQSFTLESHRAGLNIRVSLEVFCFCFKSYLMLSYETDTVTIFKLRDPEDQSISCSKPADGVRVGEGRAQVMSL